MGIDHRQLGVDLFNGTWLAMAQAATADITDENDRNLLLQDLSTIPRVSG